MVNNKIVRNVFIFTLMGTIIWLILIFMAPFLKSIDSPVNAFIYSIFAPICHQNSTRCFYFWDYPGAVCTRCLGIYLGFLLGTLAFPLINGFKPVHPPKNIIFFVFSTPIVMDTIGNLLTLWQTSDWMRAIIGLIWGILLPYYFIPGISDLFLSLNSS